MAVCTVWCVVPTITRPVNLLYTKVWLALWARVHEPWSLLCLTRYSHHEVVAFSYSPFICVDICVRVCVCVCGILAHKRLDVYVFGSVCVHGYVCVHVYV